MEYVFTRSIEMLCKPENNGYTTMKRTQPTYSLPVFLANDEKIWGLTAIILHCVLKIIAPEQYVNTIPHPPRGVVTNDVSLTGKSVQFKMMKKNTSH